VTNLQYLETPQYLRKTLFPRSDDLANSGLMNPLDSSHHLRIDEWCPYREGVVLNRPVRDGEGSWVNIGLYKDCKVDRLLEEKTRVTVKLNEKAFGSKDLKFYTGSVVSMNEPKDKLGQYWGYTVRIAEDFSELFENSIFGKYDLVLGTSDKGLNVDDVDFSEKRGFKHCLIVFGGLQGIEGMMENDEKYNGKIKKIFDYYLNTCPDQGCRTIRTEEAMLISLATIKSKLDNI
jgi:predicted SPOUT superfamily RNA methylase MTH1